MRLDQIIEELKTFRMQLLSGTDDKEILFVRKWSEGQRNYNEYTLCLTDRKNAAVNCGNAAMVWVDAEDLPKVMNRLLELLSGQKKFRNCEEYLRKYNRLLKNNNLDMDRVVEIIYELLGNPFGICNAQGELMYYKNIDQIDEYYSNLIRQGEDYWVPQKFFEINEIVKHSAVPVVLESYMDRNVRNVLSRIMVDGEVECYMLVMEAEREITDLDINAIEFVCQWLSGEFKKNRLYQKADQAAVLHFLLELLNHTAGLPEEIRERAKKLNFGQKTYHYIMVLDFGGTDLYQYPIEAIQKDCSRNIRGVTSILFRERIVLYVNLEEGIFLTEDRRKVLESLANRYDLQIGVSYRCKKLSELYKAYLQSSASIQIGKLRRPGNRIYEYDSYALYHLLEQVKVADNMLKFCNPQLMEILEHDREHNTAYVYTIYVLLLSGGRQVEAAKRLHIHRSTLLYRMEKIVEITGGFDFNDTFMVAQLYISFMILVMNQELDPEIYILP